MLPNFRIDRRTLTFCQISDITALDFHLHVDDSEVVTKRASKKMVGAYRTFRRIETADQPPTT